MKEEVIAAVVLDRKENGDEIRLDCLRSDQGFAGSVWGEPYLVPKVPTCESA